MGRYISIKTKLGGIPYRVYPGRYLKIPKDIKDPWYLEELKDYEAEVCCRQCGLEMSIKESLREGMDMEGPPNDIVNDPIFALYCIYCRVRLGRIDTQDLYPLSSYRSVPHIVLQDYEEEEEKCTYCGSKISIVNGEEDCDCGSWGRYNSLLNLL